MTDVSNSVFLRIVLGELPLGQHGWVCSWVGNPNDAPPGVWGGRPYKGKTAEAGVLDKATNCNNYFRHNCLYRGSFWIKGKHYNYLCNCSPSNCNIAWLL